MCWHHLNTYASHIITGYVVDMLSIRASDAVFFYWLFFVLFIQSAVFTQILHSWNRWVDEK